MIMNMKEVMELTGFSRSHIYKMVHRKVIPVHKPTGGKLFFVKEEIEQWLMGGRQLTGQELNAAADKILLEMGVRRNQRRSR